MPVVGIVADARLVVPYPVFVILLSEALRPSRWHDIVLMFFVNSERSFLEHFRKRLRRSARHCSPAERPRLCMRGEPTQPKHFALCDTLLFFGRDTDISDASEAYMQFPRRKRRIQWKGWHP